MATTAAVPARIGKTTKAKPVKKPVVMFAPAGKAKSVKTGLINSVRA